MQCSVALQGNVHPADQLRCRARASKSCQSPVHRTGLLTHCSEISGVLGSKDLDPFKQSANRHLEGPYHRLLQPEYGSIAPLQGWNEAYGILFSGKTRALPSLDGRVQLRGHDAI